MASPSASPSQVVQRQVTVKTNTIADTIVEVAPCFQYLLRTIKTTIAELLKKIQEKDEQLRKEGPVNVLVVGPTKSGKSELINNLLGSPEAEVGVGVDSVTSEVKKYKGEYDGVKFIVYDTTGFFDSKGRSGLDIIKEIDGVGKFHLMLVCLRMDCACDSKIQGLASFLSKKVTPDLWKSSVVVLTFANFFVQIGAVARLNNEEKPKAINEAIARFKEIICASLSDQVDEKTKSDIPFCIAGLDREEKILPKDDSWLKILWETCIDRCNPDARLFLVRRANSHLIKIGVCIAVGIVVSAVAGGVLGVYLLTPLLGKIIAAALGGSAGAFIFTAAAGTFIICKDKEIKRLIAEYTESKNYLLSEKNV